MLYPITCITNYIALLSHCISTLPSTQKGYSACNLEINRLHFKLVVAVLEKFDEYVLIIEFFFQVLKSIHSEAKLIDSIAILYMLNAKNS